MLTHADLLKTLHYDPETGEWRWLIKRGRAHPGRLAGSIGWQGRRKIRWNGTVHNAARLAWFYMTGSWPAGEVDHKDTDRLNDRWDNLREATRSQNQCNTRTYRNNISGYRGVHLCLKTKRWRAMISEGGKNYHLGYFRQKDEAIAAWRAAAIERDPEFFQTM